MPSVNPFNPFNWYWIVAGSATQVFSSSQGAFVGVGDATYTAWVAGGGLPTAIASNSLLFDVLVNTGALSVACATALNNSGGLSAAQQDIALTIVGGGLQNNLVAHAGGGQALATQCAMGVNIFTITASPNDSAQLPTALVNRVARIFNAGAQTLRVYAKNGSTDLIHTSAGSSGVSFTSLTSGQVADFGCPVNGHWATTLVTTTA